MILIAHRGLIDGPDSILENTPDQIKLALDQGFDVEIDLWKIYDDFYLGHDLPQYKISLEFLENQNFWVHCKNIDALLFMTTTSNIKYFWHQNDNYTLTSNNIIWTYPNKILTYRSIQLLPEINDQEFKNLNLNCIGICSDYVKKIKNIIHQNEKL